MVFSAPHLSYAQIKIHANHFLSKYHPTISIPVPIEEILDVKLGLNIIPIPGLIQYGVDAYTWSDLKSIVVDDYFYNNNQRRYRFTLAHELGHIILHEKILKSIRIGSIEDYLQFVNGISDEDHRWTEWQADCFAGQVLVPSKPLIEKLREGEKMAVGMGLKASDPATRGYIADWISDFFDVSRKTIETRLVYDKHWENIRRTD